MANLWGNNHMNNGTPFLQIVAFVKDLTNELWEANFLAIWMWRRITIIRAKYSSPRQIWMKLGGIGLQFGFGSGSQRHTIRGDKIPISYKDNNHLKKFEIYLMVYIVQEGRQVKSRRIAPYL
jgi:hypothetical protein